MNRNRFSLVWLCFTIALLLVLEGCSPKSPASQSPVKKGAPQLADKEISFSGELTGASSIDAIFGTQDPSWKWSPQSVCTKPNLMRSIGGLRTEGFIDSFIQQLADPDSKNTVSPHSIFKYEQDGKEQAYVVFQTEIAGCIGCSALIGAAKWQKDGNDWKVQNISKCIAPMGGIGSFQGPATLEKIGPSRYGLMIHDDFEDSRHTLLIVDGPHHDLRIALSKLTADGNTQGPNGCEDAALRGIKAGCWKYTSKLRFRPGADPEYFDLVVSKLGTIDAGKGKSKPVKNAESYRFSDGDYVLKEDK